MPSNYFRKQIVVVSLLILIVLGLGIYVLVVDSVSYIVPGVLFITLASIGLITSGIIYVRSYRIHPSAPTARLGSLEIF